MRAQWKQTGVEGGFLVLLAALCAVLTGLQYRWTGEVSRAEAERLRGEIGGQAQQFCNAFDATLTKSCNALVPRNQVLDDQNREAIHQQLWQKWKSGRPHPIFSHIAVAVPTDDEPGLFELDVTTGKLAATAWPPEWNALRKSLANKRGPGSATYENPTGLVLHFPIFSGQLPGSGGGPPRNGGPPNDDGLPGHGRPGEQEWMILELDTNYLSNTWLPELTQLYLNVAGQPVNDVVVKTVMAPKTTVYFSSPEAANNSETPVVARLNRQGRDPENYRGPPPDFRWSLEVRPHPGALEGVVSAARKKNLAVAMLFNLLILAAGFALVRHTRKSRRLAEQQLNFVAGVSHELRTPLTVIRGAAHNLQRGVVSERAQIEKYSGLIIEHCEQLTDMIEQVLALAGAQKKNSVAWHQPVALGDVLHDAIAATAHDTQAAQCAVQLELPPALPVVLGDASALRRVFQNLISNAAKHGADGKWIGVTAVADEESRPPMVEIHVADHGPGIPPAEMSEIFKPFFRGALTQALQIRGSGLGLSLVKEIVEAHHGTVGVRKNNNGHGATFIVRLPVAKTDSAK